MSKVTLSVCKVFKNSGSLRFHRKNTSKHWKHYFLEYNEDDIRSLPWMMERLSSITQEIQIEKLELTTDVRILH